MPIAAAAVDICQPTGEKKRKEVDLAANNESGPSKKKYRYKCSVDGCGNWRVEGGVCCRHGAKIERKRCSVGECTNQAVKGGVCYRHGAKVYRCSVDGCTNQAKKGRVCVKHGAQRKRCSFDNCTNQVVKGGVCIKHGAKYKRCSVEECTNIRVKGGVCYRHGAKVKLCSVEECTNYTVKGGVCTKHGANGDRCELEGCTGKGVFNGFCVYHYHQEPSPNQNYYNLQIQQQEQEQILRMGLTSTMSSLGYPHHPPQWNSNNYYYDNSFLNSNGVIGRCNFEGCNIIAIHGRFCFAHSASSFAPHAHADSQRGYVQGGGNQIAPTEIIIDAEEAGEKEQASITSRKQKEGVTEQSKTPPSCDTGEYCSDESQQDGTGHRCAVEDSHNDGSDKSLAAGVASLKDDNEQDTSDTRPQRRVRREGNQKDDAEQDASNVAPTQGGDEGGTGDAMEDGDNWDGDGQNEYSCEGPSYKWRASPSFISPQWYLSLASSLMVLKMRS